MALSDVTTDPLETILDVATEDHYSVFWQAALEGQKLPIDHNEPQPGLYRTSGTKRRSEPVRYWREGKNLLCMVGNNRLSELSALEIWPFVAQRPVTYEAFIGAMDGKPWPDMDPVVHSQTGHNKPPNDDDPEVIQAQIDAAVAGAEDYREIKDDETCAKAQVLRSRLNELQRLADKIRETEKRPFFEACKKIDNKWQPLIKTAIAAAAQIAKAMGVWETAKFIEAKKAAPAAVLLPAEPIRGAAGRAASVREIRVAAIVDQDAVYQAFRLQPEVIAVLQKLADKAVKAGKIVPGVEVREERKVV